MPLPTPAPEKDLKENHSDDANGMRERRPVARNNGISRRDYNNPIGGRRASSAGDTRTLGLEEEEEENPEQRRREIRRRLKQKHRHVVPKLWWTKFMFSETKNHMVAVLGEFIGTTMFLFFAFGGTQVANIGSGQTADGTTTGQATGFNPATLLYISLCFGFSLMVNAWVFFRISGGLFNPAVTLALTLIQGISPLRGFFLFISQISGACFAAYLVSVMFPTPFNVQTTLGGGTSLAQDVWIEGLCTAELVFTIIMLAKEKHRATYIAPVGIGLSLFIGELVAVYYTGGSLNPARSFGPAAVARSFQGDHWIYWVGPIIGSILAAAAYWIFKALEYEMANPGQDGDAENDPTVNPEHEIAQIVEERQAEVDEIQAIEDAGGFEALMDRSAPPSVLGHEGVVGMAVDGVVQGDEVKVTRKRSGEVDLEAQLPAGPGSARHVEQLIDSGLADKVVDKPSV